MEIKRGDVVIVDLEPAKGSEQSKVRPCVIIQNDIGNQYSPVTIIACITSGEKATFDTEVEIKAPEGGLKNNSIVLLNQIRTIDKSRIVDYWGTLFSDTMLLIDEALKISLGLTVF
ncbi:MAG: type II toxin-antitoxin system PemK/MazF family toxin [Candidatus Eremiobacterota bacterium]